MLSRLADTLAASGRLAELTEKRPGIGAPDHVCDHIRPHRGNEALFWDQGNLQCLCAPCHSGEKQRAEQPGRPSPGRVHQDPGFSIPFGLRPSAIPVTVLSGPPAAGKSTFIRVQAAPDDVIIDFDVYLARIGAAKWTRDREAVRRAFAMRDEDLRSLCERTDGAAWLIATAPTRQEREAWLSALGPLARSIVLDTPAALCIERIRSAPDRAHAVGDMIANVERWFSSRS